MDKDFAASIQITLHEQATNRSAIMNRKETLRLIKLVVKPHLKLTILDIGERNLLTDILGLYLDADVFNTEGDLDEKLNCPEKEYDLIHYNNVIEHQFNPLFTLLECRKVLKPDGILVLGCPVKPHWITWNPAHFHEFDLYRIHKLIERAGFKIRYEEQFYHQVGWLGIRPFLGSFFTRQYLAILSQN